MRIGRLLPAALVAGVLAWACGQDDTSVDEPNTARPSDDAGGASSDASTNDARTDGDSNDTNDGPLRCDSAGVLVCDSFDEPAIDSTRWEPELQSGAAAIDESRSYRGGRALHVTTERGGGRAMLRARQRAALAGRKVWGRTHMFVPSSAEASLTHHSNVIAFGGKNASGATSVHAVAIGAAAFFGLYFQDEPMIDESSFVLHPDVPITKVPLDRWFCLEWELDGVASAFRLYLDGALIPSSVIEGRVPATEADVLVGAEFDLEEAWLDEVVVATTRAGCLP